MFEHFKGEEVFVKKVLDYLDQVQYKQRLILTQFLDPYHQSIVKSVIGHQDEVQVLENGGFIHSESQRMIIAPYFYEIEKEDFEIVVCKIIYAKNFEKLTHRDILGALMSLGIKRELFGDIVEKDKDFYLAVDRHIYEYLKDEEPVLLTIILLKIQGFSIKEISKLINMPISTIYRKIEKIKKNFK